MLNVTIDLQKINGEFKSFYTLLYTSETDSDLQDFEKQISLHLRFLWLIDLAEKPEFQ